MTSIITWLLRSDIHFETQSPRSGSSQSAGLPVHCLEATPGKLRKMIEVTSESCQALGIIRNSWGISGIMYIHVTYFSKKKILNYRQFLQGKPSRLCGWPRFSSILCLRNLLQGKSLHRSVHPEFLEEIEELSRLLIADKFPLNFILYDTSLVLSC